MKSIKLTTGTTSKMVALVPSYDRDGDIDFLELPKNNLVSDSVTDEINFFMIDGCENSGTVGAVKWEKIA